jgi:hypothetical protein
VFEGCASTTNEQLVKKQLALAGVKGVSIELFSINPFSSLPEPVLL